MGLGVAEVSRKIAEALVSRFGLALVHLFRLAGLKTESSHRARR